MEPQAYFPVATPGYMKLDPIKLDGAFELSFMFKTGQRRGLLAYFLEISGGFFYVSLSLLDGSLELRVFPEYEIRSAKAANKPKFYNDNKWHAVTLLITEADIQLHVDDHDYFHIQVLNQEKRPQLDDAYNAYFGGLSDNVTLVPGSVAVDTPYIGCIRDILVAGSQLVNVNTVPEAPGVEKGVCRMELPFDTDEDEQKEEKEATAEGEGESSPKEKDPDDDDNVWDLFPFKEEEEPQYFGECMLPLSPARDSDVNKMTGLRFGSRKDTYLEFNRKLRIKKRSEFSIEIKTTAEEGIIFYTAGEMQTDFIALFMIRGQLVYGFNCGSGSGYIETEETFNDGEWHLVEFSRQGERGKLSVDGRQKGEQTSYGNTASIETQPEFYLGGVKKEVLLMQEAQRNLKKVTTGFVGCLRNFKLRNKMIGKWSRNNNAGVVPCSDKVEPGYFIGPSGAILAARKYRVGLDFDVTMDIKPRNVSGILLAIQGRRDYLILQMIDGTLTFTVDNGRGPITAVFKPQSPAQFCDGQWHNIHAVKAKNVVTLAVDGTFAQPGIGVPGVSSTDTNHGLWLGRHPKPDRLIGRRTDAGFVGCIRNIELEGRPLDIDSQTSLKGDVMMHVCPTI